MKTMRWLFLLALAPMTVGCGGGDPKPDPVVIVPVSGQIIYDGKPAVGVRVTLVPIDAPSPPLIPRFASGITDEQGKFKLTTITENDGAPIGGYQVVLDGSIRNSVDNVGAEDTGDSDIFKGWFDTMHSNLNVRIDKNTSELPPFKIAKITRPAGMSEGIPGRN